VASCSPRSRFAAALAAHDAKITAVVPHYAMSGGTLIALAADEILLDSHAVCGPRAADPRPSAARAPADR
jgi:ClpP class serine protease